MIKKFILLFTLFLLFPVLNVFALDLDFSAKYVILYNMNDNVLLFEQNSNEKTNIASLTKIMTALVALNEIDNLDSTVTITSNDFLGTEGYSKAGFNIGDVVTYKDLLYGVLLPSGAEAVNALVNNTLGYDKFIAKMNEMAKNIGLKNTSFSNPIGKDDENNYSTAGDVANLLKYALENATFKEIFETKEYVTTNGVKLECTLYPYKNLLDINLIDGSKSGFTKGAGRCLASITNLNDVNYLLVVINSNVNDSKSAVFDSINIYSYYDENYSYQEIINNEMIIESIPVKFANIEQYDIKVNENVDLFLENGTVDNLTYEYEGLQNLDYKVKKGDKLGTVFIYNQEDLLYKTDIYLKQDINYYYSYIYLIFVFVLFLIILFFIKKKRMKKRK